MVLRESLRVTDAMADHMESVQVRVNRETLEAFTSGSGVGIQSEIVARELPPFQSFMDEQCSLLTEVDARLSPEDRRTAVQYHKMRVQPMFMSTRMVRRSVDQPFGYPGDYQMVEILFTPQRERSSTFAQILSQYLFDLGPSRAHRARVPWALGHIRSREATADRPLEVLSYACGPERVMREYFAEGGTGVNLTLCDFDPRALAHASAQIQKATAKRDVRPTVRTIKNSAFDLIRDPGSAGALSSARPDGLYDVVMVLGLFDYLTDQLIDKFLTALTSVLAPGGLCLVTNICENNPWRALMEYTGDWTVIHRSKDAFGQLVAGDGRLRQQALITDATGTNVYFCGVK